MNKSASLIICIIIATVLLIGGCSGAMNPEGVVEACWKALEDGDIDKAVAHMSERYRVNYEENTDNEEIPGDIVSDYIGALTRAMSLTVTGEEIDGNRAVVHATVSEPDREELDGLMWGKLFEMSHSGEHDFDNMSREEAIILTLQVYIEMLELVEAKVTTELELSLIKEDGSWKIDGNVIPPVEHGLGF